LFRKPLFNVLLIASLLSVGEASYEEEYTISESFFRKYICYIQIQRNNVLEKGLIIGIPCEDIFQNYISSNFIDFTSFFEPYGRFDHIQEIDLHKNSLIWEFVITKLEHSLGLNTTKSLKGFLMTHIILTLLKKCDM